MTATLEPIRSERAADGTVKWSLGLADGREVEAVWLPDRSRGERGRSTACVSSQVGCSLTCSFCYTGTLRHERDLDAAEIVAQVRFLRERADLPLTNVVFMGMGEPLLNLDAVEEAVGELTGREPHGLGLSRRRVTVSTAGVVPAFERVARMRCRLAVSLHATRDAVRDELVPINRRWPLAELVDACRAWPGRDRIVFEYALIADVNDGEREAGELAELLAGVPSKVNLIPFNGWPGTRYRAASPAALARFSDALYARGVAVTVRAPRGREVLAACGQLANARTTTR